jgi:hypothetical protein
MLEVFKIDCGRFCGDSGEDGEFRPSRIETMLLRTISTGTGFIITLEPRFLNPTYYYSYFNPFLLPLFLITPEVVPQLINLEDLIISTGFVAEFWTFYLNRESIFLNPLSLSIFANSSYCLILRFASSSI